MCSEEPPRGPGGFEPWHGGFEPRLCIADRARSCDPWVLVCSGCGRGRLFPPPETVDALLRMLCTRCDARICLECMVAVATFQKASRVTNAEMLIVCTGKALAQLHAPLQGGRLPPCVPLLHAIARIADSDPILLACSACFGTIVPRWGELPTCPVCGSSLCTACVPACPLCRVMHPKREATC